jgi:hypothetical protein
MKSKLTDFQLRILEKDTLACEDVVALLGDYTDEDLSCSLRGRLDAHMRECAHCREFSDSYKFTVQLASELEDKPIPTDVQNRLRQALNKRLGIDLPLVD